MSGAVAFQELRNVGDKWVIGVGISQQGTDGKQDLANRQSRTPLIFENIQTDASVRVDVTVIDTGSEMDLGGLERIVGREVDIQKENSSSIW